MKEYYISYGHVEGRIIKTDIDIETLVEGIMSQKDKWIAFEMHSGKIFYVKGSEIYSVEPV